jgi:hypothetical protein
MPLLKKAHVNLIQANIKTEWPHVSHGRDLQTEYAAPLQFALYPPSSANSADSESKTTGATNGMGIA